MRPSHISERDIRLFLVLDALLEHGSVTRAATRLGVTQSAVSHALRALRERFHDPLFVRNGNAMLATPRALSLRPSLRLGLSELERMLTGEAAFAVATTARLFSVATTDDMIFTVVPDLVVRFRNEAPDASIRFDPIGPNLQDALTNGLIDVAMASGHAEPALRLDRSMVRMRVASDGWTCLMRVGHPAAAAGVLTLDTYLAFPHVAVTTTGTIDPVDAALAATGRVRRVAVTVASFPAAGWFAAGSDMITTLPQRVGVRAAQRLDLATAMPPLQLPPNETYLWWHERFQRDAGHAWWRGRLAAAFDLPEMGGGSAQKG